MKSAAPNRFALVALLTIATGWYGYVRAHQPTLAMVNGVYSNPCCGDIIIENGVIKAGGAETHFKLEQMKFGLTIYPDKALAVEDSRLVFQTDNKAEALLITGDGASLSVPGNPENQLFVRRRAD